jgi:hypothetical protein
MMISRCFLFPPGIANRSRIKKRQPFANTIDYRITDKIIFPYHTIERARYHTIHMIHTIHIMMIQVAGDYVPGKNDDSEAERSETGVTGWRKRTGAGCRAVREPGIARRIRSFEFETLKVPASGRRELRLGGLSR